MNKTELVAAIAADTNLAKADAARDFDSALEHLAGALAKGEAVQLIGFGNFTVSNRAERSGRNPSTGWTSLSHGVGTPTFLGVAKVARRHGPC